MNTTTSALNSNPSLNPLLPWWIGYVVESVGRRPGHHSNPVNGKYLWWTTGMINHYSPSIRPTIWLNLTLALSEGTWKFYITPMGRKGRLAGSSTNHLYNHETLMNFTWGRKNMLTDHQPTIYLTIKGVDLQPSNIATEPWSGTLKRLCFPSFPSFTHSSHSKTICMNGFRVF